jgi:RNA polymerase sigma-70 factor (ECF subfamily)
VRNGALDVLRKRKPEHEGAVAQLEDTDLSPAEVTEQNELKTIIRQQLDGMDVAQREIVLLRDFHNLSYAEIAEMMEIRAGTVMSRLHRARKELRQRIRKYLK